MLSKFAMVTIGAGSLVKAEERAYHGYMNKAEMSPNVDCSNYNGNVGCTSGS
jgi:hypothetical protein